MIVRWLRLRRRPTQATYRGYPVDELVETFARLASENGDRS